MLEYQNLIIREELKYPEIYHEDVVKYSQTKISDDDIKVTKQESPFKRYVDMWFFAVCLGAQQDKLHKFPSSEMHKFHDGSILVKDSWRIELLATLAIGYTNNYEIISESKGVINLANNLAGTGLPIVIEMLGDTLDDSITSAPIWNLSRRLSILLSD